MIAYAKFLKLYLGRNGKLTHYDQKFKFWIYQLCIVKLLILCNKYVYIHINEHMNTYIYSFAAFSLCVYFITTCGRLPLLSNAV